MPNALFRCDGGPQVGIGHTMRCRALAAVFLARQWCCWFAVTRDSRGLFAEPNAIIVPAGDDGAPAVAAAMATKNIDCLVVDHYGLGAAFERSSRARAAAVVAIDDLADRAHDCDLIVDATPARKPSDYSHLTGSKTQCLLGPDYALLRPEFAASRAARPHDTRLNAKRLLITLGGSDADNISGRVLAALASIPGVFSRPLLVIGPANLHMEELMRTSHSLAIQYVVDPPDMVGLMAEADLAITACGVSCLELACLGTPMLAIVTADNQRAAAQAIERAGAARVLGNGRDVDTKLIAESLAALAGDAAARQRMAREGRNLVDGRGAARIADAIEKIIADKNQEI